MPHSGGGTGLLETMKDLAKCSQIADVLTASLFIRQEVVIQFSPPVIKTNGDDMVW